MAAAAAAAAADALVDAPTLIVAVGRLTSRRRLSAKLVFYDLQRLPDAAADGGSLASPAGQEQWVEVVLKVGVCGGEERVKELRDSLKLGDVVEVTGHADGASSIQAVSIVVLQPWREQQPEGASFVPQPAPHHKARQRLPLQQLCGSGDAGAGGSSSPQHQAAAAGPAGPARSADAQVRPPQVPVCKYWINTRACARGSACPFLHPPLPAARAGVRRRAGAGPAPPAADTPSRTQWLADRLQARRGAAEGAGFVHAASAAARRRRAAVLAAWLVDTYGVEALSAGAGVLDVAGGRGGLTFELVVRHGVRCTLVDPRPLRLTKFQHRHLNEAGRAACIHSIKLQPQQDQQLQPCGAAGAAAGGSAANQGLQEQQEQHQAGESSSSSDGDSYGDGTPGQHEPQQQGASEAAAAAAPVAHLHHVQARFGPELWDQPAWQARFGAPSLVVGLHPDQATNAIVEYALRQRVPFAVVPCCVFPRLFPARRVRLAGGGGELRPVTSYQELVQWLLQRAEGVTQTAVLPFEGANVAVYVVKWGA